jgi:hypothetical protein
MKPSYRFTITDRQRSKKKKKAAKSVTAASIAQRYVELLRLRERISEVESLRAAR